MFARKNSLQRLQVQSNAISACATGWWPQRRNHRCMGSTYTPWNSYSSWQILGFAKGLHNHWQQQLCGTSVIPCTYHAERHYCRLLSEYGLCGRANKINRVLLSETLTCVEIHRQEEQPLMDSLVIGFVEQSSQILIFQIHDTCGPTVQNSAMDKLDKAPKKNNWTQYLYRLQVKSLRIILQFCLSSINQ